MEKIIKGKQQIAIYFDCQRLQNLRLEWEPEFVEAARAGDMAHLLFKQFKRMENLKQLRDISVKYGKSKRTAAGSLSMIHLLL